MPITPAVIETAKMRVQHDIVGGFDGVLSPANPSPFSISLTDSDLMEADIVGASDSVVVVPWAYTCVHTGPFLSIPPTFIEFELRGATFVNVESEEEERWVYHRYVDYLCALHHIGISTSVRPALEVADYLNWDVNRRSLEG